jgi:hypothetical protein
MTVPAPLMVALVLLGTTLTIAHVQAAGAGCPFMMNGGDSHGQ